MCNTLIVSILDGIGLEMPAELAPKSVAVSKLCETSSAAYMLRCRVSMYQRKQGISFVIEVAKQADLSQSCFGDVETLAAATSCSWLLAKNVLIAIHDGIEPDLLQTSKQQTGQIFQIFCCCQKIRGQFLGKRWFLYVTVLNAPNIYY